MSPVISSQSMVLATAMAVSGTVILFALRFQKNPSNSPPLLSRPLPPSCIISPGDEKKREKKKKKKKKRRVHFAEDVVVDPIGNSDLYRKKLLLQHGNSSSSSSNNNCESSNSSIKKSDSSTVKRLLGGKVKEMPENRVALYNGILRDRVFHRVAYSCRPSKLVVSCDIINHP